jgi:hypothetical protein
MTGVALTMFSHADPATGDHEICILTSETGYFELERQAQRRGKTVEGYLYGEMAYAFTAQGIKVPPGHFYVTAGRPDAFPASCPATALPCNEGCRRNANPSVRGRRSRRITPIKAEAIEKAGP